MAFNDEGTLLATGTLDGSLVLFDFETRGVAKIHEKVLKGVVTSVSWSADGRKVLISSNVEVAVVAVKEWKILEKIHVDEPAVFTNLHPRGHCFLASYAKSNPKIHYLDGTTKATPVAMAGTAAEDPKSPSTERGAPSVYPIIANFARAGALILLGNAKGEVEFLETSTLTSVHRADIPTAASIVTLSDNFSGDLIAINCSGKPGIQGLGTARAFVQVLRVRPDGPIVGFDQVGDFYDPTHGLTKGTSLGWTCFSWDDAYLVGTSCADARHHITIWELESGKVEHVLTSASASGDQEGLKTGLPSIWHVDWCPHKAVLVTVGSSGKAYIWTKKYQENWSCFAPDFRELANNEEYVEKEDEFDANVPMVPKETNEAYTNEAIVIM